MSKGGNIYLVKLGDNVKIAYSLEEAETLTANETPSVIGTAIFRITAVREDI